MGSMESTVEVSVSVPAELWQSVQTAADDDCVAPSTLLSEALQQHLSRRARLHSVAAWAWAAETVALGDQFAGVDPVLDTTGCA